MKRYFYIYFTGYLNGSVADGYRIISTDDGKFFSIRSVDAYLSTQGYSKPIYKWWKELTEEEYKVIIS